MILVANKLDSDSGNSKRVDSNRGQSNGPPLQSLVRYLYLLIRARLRSTPLNPPISMGKPISRYINLCLLMMEATIICQYSEVELR